MQYKGPTGPKGCISYLSLAKLGYSGHIEQCAQGLAQMTRVAQGACCRDQSRPVGQPRAIVAPFGTQKIEAQLGDTKINALAARREEMFFLSPGTILGGFGLLKNWGESSFEIMGQGGVFPAIYPIHS